MKVFFLAFVFFSVASAEDSGDTCYLNYGCGDPWLYCKSNTVGECYDNEGTCTWRFVEEGECDDDETWAGDPVCGCDGITYESKCVVAFVSQNIDYEGVCEGDDDYYDSDSEDTTLRGGKGNKSSTEKKPKHAAKSDVANRVAKSKLARYAAKSDLAKYLAKSDPAVPVTENH
mmetsp:Transcript_39718/g.93032  ORF Transcript_39718/g.93032 Transcript_39718/m.93032 type:complete len:173 (-) Transcript_39718:191-709(-)|eukprot:CAMPEP_0113306082 /NCGR_PEP_ID=MMETSP0010_2-20120614/5476_1 /TAXON_ID=216773 ORGANISM="Corethron hystrix, Strain 308" /NCGR_SAMPLE_ID=MMETSP0010_2 /ASSEMBLY_ACC=CAM_ASM_000155 /LENGTH=172 /DNA_ID=CAMNT_0000160679 /DNA_START=119 /DNA_END=637 /DNA_ORIENTATION=+ /assembly_acc=CAM_ASM_000155